MTRALLRPEHEAFPNRRRWTVEECYRLRDLGFLEGKYEVIDGEVVNKMGQKPSHRITVILVVEWLSGLFGVRRVQAEGPIGLGLPDGLYSEPEPDVAVTREPTTAYADRHPGPADLLLVLEVSDTTLRTDLLVKARLYARAGILEFWVLDITSRELHVHRDPRQDEYASITVHRDIDSVSLLSQPDASISVCDLLPPIEP